MGKTLLDGGNTLVLCFENFNCLLLAFFRVHQKLQLWLNILTTKWYIFVQNKVALIIKNSKDSKNGAKCYHRPLHHSFLSNPLKNLWHRYFNIGASKFFICTLNSFFQYPRSCGFEINHGSWLHFVLDCAIINNGVRNRRHYVLQLKYLAKDIWNGGTWRATVSY